MSIVNTQLSSPLSNGGVSPNNLTQISNSQLHNEYSINGNPTLTGKPIPSTLDPTVPAIKYTDNLPV